MKKLSSLFFILIMLSACAKEEMRGQDPELQPYISSLKSEYYEATGEELDTDISINIKELDGVRRGSCRKQTAYANSTREIFIDRTTFENSKDNPANIKAIILHEIGHCLYNFNHDDSLTMLGDKQAPKSIMYPKTLLTVEMFESENRDYYYIEFNERARARYTF